MRPMNFTLLKSRAKYRIRYYSPSMSKMIYRVPSEKEKERWIDREKGKGEAEEEEEGEIETDRHSLV